MIIIMILLKSKKINLNVIFLILFSNKTYIQKKIYKDYLQKELKLHQQRHHHCHLNFFFFLNT